MKKTVLITGTSTGFGRVTAELFANNGWNVIATMRNPAASTLPARDDIFVTKLDVEDKPSIDAAVAAGIARFGRIDALVNNAGFGLFGVFEAISAEKIREQFDVNVFGLMEVTRAVLPHFRANRAGLILNITSGAGVFGLPMISLYTASKFAVEGFSESLSYELASQGVTVKLIEPGGVTSTRFGERSAAEAGSQMQNLPTDYGAFVEGSLKVFEGLRQNRLASEEDVAKVIYDAATDGTDRLRYVATDDIKPLVAARRETSEEQYMAMMRSQFGVRN